MKIYYDYQIFFDQKYGGPSRYFIELFKELQNINGVKPYIVSPFYINEHLKNFCSKYKIGKYLNNKKYFGKIYKIYNDIVSRFYINKINPDILHLTYFNRIIKNKKLPLVVTVYDLIHEIYSKDFKVFYPKKKILQRANHIICISKNTKNDLQKYYDIKEEKISVIYLANSLVNKYANKQEWRAKKNFLLFVGSRKRYKNFRILLEAYSEIKTINKNFDLVCFGGGEFLEEEIKSIKDLNLSLENVKNYQGDDIQLCSLYKSATLLVYPSLNEGFGMPILEAMANDCPVISSNRTSLPEVYGNAALSFDPESKEDLKNCIERIIYSKDLNKELILLGKKRILDFSWKKCANETHEVYQKLI